MVGARKVSQIEQAIDALSFRLSDADQALITAAGSIAHPFPHCFLEGATFDEIVWARPAGRIVRQFDAPVARHINTKKSKATKSSTKK